jgi:alpha-L-rhamnosidase
VQGSAELEWESDGGVMTRHLDDGESSLVAWPFPPLLPRQRGRLRARARSRDDRVSSWSAWTDVVGGFLEPGGWRASFIKVANPSREAEPFQTRRLVEVGPGLTHAMLYATARGVYQVEINGMPIDDHVLKPGWTAYQHRLTHESTDVTGLLRTGLNVIGASVAGGWFTERYGFFGLEAPFYGSQADFAAQLVLEYEDGRTETVVTDSDWRVTTDGPIRLSGIYAGEEYDARLADPQWSTPDGADRDWDRPSVEPDGPVPRTGVSPPVRVVQELAVREVHRSASGATILDFGQNLVGRVRLRVTGPAGAEIRLRHAEVLDGGELALRPLRLARATDRYVLAGHAEEIWEPAFTFHGFRYVEVTGWPGALDPGAFVARVVHSDMERTGWFSTSHPLLDRLHENVVWGMRGNFLSLPTDCPQRDERLGWTGDIQVFAPTATFLFDCDAFLASWLEDLRLEQEAAGGVPHVVPDVLRSSKQPAAAWGDAATVVPSVLYERFGDIELLRRQFGSMRAWVDQIAAIAGPRRLWEGKFQYGDWLDPDAPADRPGQAKTAHDIVASAYLYRSASLVEAAARVLGLEADVQAYGRLAEEVREAWLAQYVTPAGRVMSDAQTAYALAIEFGIAREPELVAAMGHRLAWLVRRDGYHIGTGFVGTPLVADALTHTGQLEVAGRLLLQTDLPSWLYPVVMGATTVWERWDSLLPDGSVNPGEMTSFNHYAFGAVADWLHRTVAGLAPLAPGYRALLVAPHPLPGLDWAQAEHETPYGRASVRWEAVDGSVMVQAVVPPNTTATIRLPGQPEVFVASGRHEWKIPDPRPRLNRLPPSLDSPRSAVIDDAEAYELVVATVAARDARRAEELRRRTEWIDSRDLRSVFVFAPPELVAEVGAALAGLARSRGLA